MEADFTGYATKANLKCSDGRTIAPDAFKHQDQTTVPLVWQHARNEPANILGHAILENRPDGVHCRAFFNDSPTAQNAKMLVEHKDINQLSIYANQLIEKSKTVMHGMIREVSLVLAGANPGALIEFVNVRHSDGEIEELDDEAVIYTGLEFEHADKETVVEDPKEPTNDEVEHADDKTIADVFNTLTDEQKNVVFFMVGEALKGNAENVSHTDLPIKETFDSLTDEQRNAVDYMIGKAIEHNDASDDDTENTTPDDSDPADDNSAAHADDKEGNSMTHNVFEGATDKTGAALNHSAAYADIFAAAKRGSGANSLRSVVQDYAESNLEHGIDSIDILFPDAKAVTSSPEFLKRRTEWVNAVMTGTRHTPFARIKSLAANLTLIEARAKGYIKGNKKAEEFFRVSKRITTPQTIYKKQQLDRDDILDIADFDVVVWLKAEMRLMLEEEIARAVLIGDGRSGGDPDKINETNVRPISTDDDFYATKLYINLGDASSSADEIIDALTLQRRHYRGSGNPTFFTSETVLAQLLLIKDSMGRRIYSTVLDLQAALRVSNIVPVEVMDEPSSNVVGILVNLSDYTIGADRGGDVALFDDFDIDYNQYKYLIETRISGALTKPKSALVVMKTASNAVLVDPVAPSWNAGTHTLTVATTTGIVYKNKDTGGTLVTGTPVVLSAGQELTVIAVPQTGYYLSSTAGDEFLFDYDRGRVDAAF